MASRSPVRVAVKMRMRVPNSSHPLSKLPLSNMFSSVSRRCLPRPEADRLCVSRLSSSSGCASSSSAVEDSTAREKVIDKILTTLSIGPRCSKVRREASCRARRRFEILYDDSCGSRGLTSILSILLHSWVLLLVFLSFNTPIRSSFQCFRPLTLQIHNQATPDRQATQRRH